MMNHKRHVTFARYLAIVLFPLCSACTEVEMVSVPSTVDTNFGGTIHGFPVDALQRCQTLGWLAVCNDALYTDDQRLRLSATVFGPHVFLAPAPDLNTYTTIDAFSSPTLIGFAYVTGDPAFPTLPAPSSYSALKLSYGDNCIYLHKPAGPNNLPSAYVVPTTGTCSTTYVPQPSHRLNVHPRSLASPHDEGSDADVAARIAPVVRFHEASGHVSEPTTVIGIKCGNRWCLLHGENTNFDVGGIPKGSQSSPKTWRVQGWSDAQRLAAYNPGGKAVPSSQSATIIATNQLASNVWDLPAGADPTSAQHAATIIFDEEPRGKYSTDWGFRKGENRLYIWRGPGGTWQGEVQNTKWNWWPPFTQTTFRIPVFVDKRHSGMGIPASARFRWNDDDDEVWVWCDDGCCYVNAFQ